MIKINLKNQLKRQREWVYLSHYLAITGLQPVHIISGNDDGHEPDFTLMFYQKHKLINIGIELTTLPRLRDQMGDEHLISMRWYWQSLLIAAQLRLQKEQQHLSTNSIRNSYLANNERFKLPVRTLYMPSSQFLGLKQLSQRSPITQQDIDAVMVKKTHKVTAYADRRPLDKLWLLIHTDKYQPHSILTEPNSTDRLTHNSGFDQVHITRYPSHKVIKVNSY